MISVEDEDTIRVMGGKREKVTIRIACVDAHETSQFQQKVVHQNSVGTYPGPVYITKKPDQRPLWADCGRDLCRDRNINFQMFLVGASYVYRQYLKQFNRNAYLRAKNAAIKKGLRGWGPCKPVQVPWE